MNLIHTIILEQTINLTSTEQKNNSFYAQVSSAEVSCHHI
jgi:hypothetical protein